MSKYSVVHVTKAQLSDIASIAGTWNGSDRWIPALTEYLWEQDIRPSDECYPSCPDTYNFLSGGIDHFSETRRSLTVHDRCLQISSGTMDGTTKFVARAGGTL